MPLHIRPHPHEDRPDFTPSERSVVGGLTALLTLRMLGFYLVLPILAPYVRGLAGSTPLLVGMSVGVYGLAQALLQVPFGAWGDRWGRRPVLTVGLLSFALGSVVCAIAHDARLMVLGRLVQGVGAISSTLVAMLADHTRDRVRTRAMAMIGVAVGGSFAAGLLFGPAAAARFGIPALFWLTAVLSVLAVVWLWWKIPDPPLSIHHEEIEYSRGHFLEVLLDRNLLRLDLGAFNLHVVLTAIFVTVPFLLRHLLAEQYQWRFFLPVLAVGLAALILAPPLSEKRGRPKKVAVAGQLVLAASLVVLALGVPASVREPRVGLTTLIAGLLLFVIAFAVLEPLFPALITRFCPSSTRGTALGVFNMSMFSGAFVGGIVSGLLIESNVEALFWILTGTTLSWIALGSTLNDPER